MCSQRLGNEPFDARKLSHLSKGSGRLRMNPTYWRKDAEDGTSTCNPAQGVGGRAVGMSRRLLKLTLRQPRILSLSILL